MSAGTNWKIWLKNRNRLLKNQRCCRVFLVVGLVSRRPSAFFKVLGFDVQFTVGSKLAVATHLGNTVATVADRLVRNDFSVVELHRADGHIIGGGKIVISDLLLFVVPNKD